MNNYSVGDIVIKDYGDNHKIWANIIAIQKDDDGYSYKTTDEPDRWITDTFFANTTQYIEIKKPFTSGVESNPKKDKK